MVGLDLCRGAGCGDREMRRREDMRDAWIIRLFGWGLGCRGLGEDMRDVGIIRL